MNEELKRAEIIVNGLVQGVGYRYFVLSKATALNLNGYVRNMFSGEVFTEVEGSRVQIEELFRQLKIGPLSADVKNAKIVWKPYEGEFKDFKVRY